jgi:hypothetical protein
MFSLSLSLSLAIDMQRLLAHLCTQLHKNSIVFAYDVEMQKMRTERVKEYGEENETTTFSFVADHSERRRRRLSNRTRNSNQIIDACSNKKVKNIYLRKREKRFE